MPEPTLAAAVLAVREHVEMFRALEVLADAVEQAGGIAEVVRELEQERELLRIEVETLIRERGRLRHD